jgi:P27 family predicted phage terminase small subunit
LRRYSGRIVGEHRDAGHPRNDGIGIVTRGRKPVPTELKLLRGNPGKRAVNRDEPKPDPKAPGMPVWLSNEARAEWRRVVPELERLGLSAKVDRAALAAYCETWATFVAAERLIHEKGLLIMRVIEEVTGSDGNVLELHVSPTKNPAVIIARDAAAQVRAFCSEFGLTPSARTRLQMPEAEDGDDGFGALLS